MLNKIFVQQLKKNYQTSTKERRMIISEANNILHDAKRVIFAVHRPDLATAQKSLTDIETRLKKLQKNFGYHRLSEEGAYTAAVEEYVEAKFFFLTTSNKKIDKIAGLELSVDSYLGGLSDLTGELVRQAINAAASQNFQQVKTNSQIINEVMAELVEFDMTGYLRTKYDQARNNLRKIEQINYELSLKD